MNGKQTAVVVAGGALSAGAVAGYALLHGEARASKIYRTAPLDPNAGYEKVIAVERLALMRQVPIYPESYFGLYFPVTSFTVADATWPTWLDLASSYSDARDHLVDALQTISDEVADRVGGLSPSWRVGLNPLVGNWGGLFNLSFEQLFGDAARQASGTTEAYFTSLEAQQFWQTLIDVALMVDYHQAFDPSFWGRVADGVGGEIAEMPRSAGQAAAFVTRTLGELGSQILGGALGGALAGLFSSWVVPALVTVGAGAGGYYLYRRFGKRGRRST